MTFLTKCEIDTEILCWRDTSEYIFYARRCRFDYPPYPSTGMYLAVLINGPGHDQYWSVINCIDSYFNQLNFCSDICNRNKCFDFRPVGKSYGVEYCDDDIFNPDIDRLDYGSLNRMMQNVCRSDPFDFLD